MQAFSLPTQFFFFEQDEDEVWVPVTANKPETVLLYRLFTPADIGVT